MRPPRHPHLRPRIIATALAAVALTLAAPGAAWAQDRPVPTGFTVASREAPAEGVEHLVLTRSDPPMVAHVARIAPGAPVSLRAVLSNDTVAGADPNLETTSRMCERVHCLLGINADFAGVGTNQPLGAFVTDGELLRSPSNTHHQLSVTADGALTDQTFAWTGRLMTTDLQQLNFDGVNVARPAGRVVLYTPSFGPTTMTTPGVDLVVRVVEPTGEFRLGQTTSVELLSLNEGAQDAPIPPGSAVLSGDGAGADALRSLWARVGAAQASRVALLRVEIANGPDVLESVGGSPILVKDGKRWFTDPGDNFTRGRHPRTLVGWTPGGETLLVTVDGRQPAVSVGMSLYEATDFLLGLGATEGMNLDGGGSTTFVRRGQVVNSVSDVQVRVGGRTELRPSTQKGVTVVGRVERPVASALVVVPSIAVSVPPVDPFAGVDLGLREQALARPGSSLPSPSVSASAARAGRSTPSTALASDDPASSPDGRLPALVGPRPKVGAPLVRVAVVLDVLALTALAFAGLALRRRGGLRRRRRPGPMAENADQGAPLLSE